MKNVMLLICVLLSATTLLALDAYPKTSIAEDATATWCTFCPNAYAGLEIVRSAAWPVMTASAVNVAVLMISSL